MKKLIVLLSAFCVLATGCGGKSPESSGDTTPTKVVYDQYTDDFNVAANHLTDFYTAYNIIIKTDKEWKIQDEISPTFIYPHRWSLSVLAAEYPDYSYKDDNGEPLKFDDYEAFYDYIISLDAGKPDISAEKYTNSLGIPLVKVLAYSEDKLDFAVYYIFRNGEVTSFHFFPEEDNTDGLSLGELDAIMDNATY